MSKGKEIVYQSFETQKYLKGESKLSKESQRKILHIRIRDVFVKSNFPMAFSDTLCSAPISCKNEKTQSHVYSCIFLSQKNQISSSDIKFEQIFGDCTTQQEIVSEIFFQRFNKLKEYFASRNQNAGRPGDPRISLGIKEARHRKKTNKHKYLKQAHIRKGQL